VLPLKSGAGIGSSEYVPLAVPFMMGMLVFIGDFELYP
jgi:hypothetical protein